MPRKHTPPKPGPHAVYTQKDLLQKTRAKKTELIHWSAIKLITPDIEDVPGTGHFKLHSALNVYEVEIAKTLNLRKIPTKTIAYALYIFRNFHEQCAALWSAGPIDGDAMTPEQFRGLSRAMARAKVRLDAFHGEKTTTAYYMRAFRRQDSAFTAEEQLDTLRHARKWRQFIAQEPGYERFFLVVDPVNDNVTIPLASELVSDLSDDNRDTFLADAFITVNLNAVLGFLFGQRVTLV